MLWRIDNRTQHVVAHNAVLHTDAEVDFLAFSSTFRMFLACAVSVLEPLHVLAATHLNVGQGRTF